MRSAPTSATPVRVALFGATGRMGRSLLRAIHDSTDYELAGALASSDSPAIGHDAGRVATLGTDLGVRVSRDRAEVLTSAEVAIDFSVAAATDEHLEACVARGCGLLIGTTGLAPETRLRIEAASARIPVIVAANTSLGVALLARLVAQTAAALPPEYDIEVIEAHHRYKVDAPSGTALKLGEAAALARGTSLPRAGMERLPGARREGSIGFASIRGGDIAGDHTVLFAGPGERIELTHRAHDRMTFAYGALRAASWLRAAGPGLYSMEDVLGLG
jgi:4-hydroxy-tetrahydrodipicolinate reductase